MKNLKNHEKEELKRKAFQLYEDGSSYQDIATELGIGKTTAYNWIAYDYPKYDSQPVSGTNSEQLNGNPNENSESGELNVIKKELEEEYGSNKDVAVLADLKKAQMEHDILYEQMLHEQKMDEEKLKSDRLKKQMQKIDVELAKLKQNNEQLSQGYKELSLENETLREFISELPPEEITDIDEEELVSELDEEIQEEYIDRINAYLNLDNEAWEHTNIIELLEFTVNTSKKLNKWLKNNNKKKTDSVEHFNLKQIMISINEILDDFDEEEGEELTIILDSDFDLELKENYPDLVKSDNENNNENDAEPPTTKNRRRRRKQFQKETF